MAPPIEAALALGASPRQCTASVMRRSERLAKVPVIAGADPPQVVRSQVVVFMLLAAVSLTTAIVSRPPPAACSAAAAAAAAEALTPAGGGVKGGAAAHLSALTAYAERAGCPWRPALARMSR